ncbi:MAG: hypothetical protein V1761_00760 [bacterium]
MKKPLVALLLLFAGFLPLSCSNAIPDYSVDEAFVLMNEAITTWLEADSFILDYHGLYEGSNYTNDETMTVKMKRTGSDALLGSVTMAITENDVSYQTVNQYEDGYVYTIRTENDTTENIKQAYTRADYETLYRSFLKRTFQASDVRSVQILVDSEQCTVTFELAASVIEQTLFVANTMERVTYATVAVTFAHRGPTLLSLSVEYNAYIDSILGTETYEVAFTKLNRYVVIPTLSATEKATYTESDDDGE